MAHLQPPESDPQACTEMVMPLCTDGVQDMFEPQAWDFQAFSDECQALFGVRPRASWAETLYGGKELSAHSNIIFRYKLARLPSRFPSTCRRWLLPFVAHCNGSECWF